MMTVKAFHEALAFIEANVGHAPLVHLVLDDDKRLIGYLVSIVAPGRFMLEPSTGGERDRVEIDLTRVKSLRAIVPGKTVRIFV
jgi:hypothetical protein